MISGIWKKSSRCECSACIEIDRSEPGVVRIRNSRRPDVIVTATDEEWAAFIAGVGPGEFDLEEKQA